jgi:hypothetical protein
VNFSLFEKLAPAHQPEVSLQAAVDDLKKGLESIGFTDPDFRQSRLIRLKSIQNLVANSIVDENLFINKY